MDLKQKYVRLKEYGEIIIFPCLISHDEFKHMNVVSAGFCYIDADNKKVDCFGESVSLGLCSNPAVDTQQATKQIFGIDAVLNLM